MCLFGMTSTCVGPCGFRSSKANVCSSSKTFLDGTSPRIIRQNKQSAIREPPSRLDFTITRQVTRSKLLNSFRKTIPPEAATSHRFLSVEAHHKHRPFRCLGLMGHVIGALAVVIQHSGTHPPASGGTLKLDDFGG